MIAWNTTLLNVLSIHANVQARATLSSLGTPFWTDEGGDQNGSFLLNSWPGDRGCKTQGRSGARGADRGAPTLWWQTTVEEAGRAGWSSRARCKHFSILESHLPFIKAVQTMTYVNKYDENAHPGSGAQLIALTAHHGQRATADALRCLRVWHLPYLRCISTIQDGSDTKMIAWFVLSFLYQEWWLSAGPGLHFPRITWIFLFFLDFPCSLIIPLFSLFPTLKKFILFRVIGIFSIDYSKPECLPPIFQSGGWQQWAWYRIRVMRFQVASTIEVHPKVSLLKYIPKYHFSWTLLLTVHFYTGTHLSKNILILAILNCKDGWCFQIGGSSGML